MGAALYAVADGLAMGQVSKAWRQTRVRDRVRPHPSHVVSCVLLAASAWGPGCKGTKSGEAPTDAKGEAARAFWLRSASLLDATRQRTVYRIDAPTIVEWLGNGRVRVRPNAASSASQEGFLAPAVLETPRPDEGLALYAERQADLHLTTEDGPVVGQILPGAFVGIVPAGPRHFLVAVPGFVTVGPPEKLAPAAASKSLRVFVQADVMGVEPPAGAPLPSQGQLVEDSPPNIPLGASAPESDIFTTTLCGDIRILEETPTGTRIGQYHAGIQIMGWLLSPISVRRGPIRCTIREVFRDGAKWISLDGTSSADRKEISVVPEEYRKLEAHLADDIPIRVLKGQPVYWLRLTKSGVQCSRWRAVRVKPSGGKSTGSWIGDPITLDGQPFTPEFGLDYRPAAAGEPAVFDLSGPHFLARGKQGASAMAGGYRATTRYTLVGSTEQGLRILPGSWWPALVAWHPDDEERWYWSATDCEAARAAAQARIEAGERHPAGGLHLDAFEELDP